MTDKIAILVLSKAGMKVAETLKAALENAEIHGAEGRVEAKISFSDTIAHLQAIFAKKQTIIGLFSSAILIRALGPVLGNKREDPPVIAVSENGSAVVPLLGGHHGGNDLARKIAALLETKAAITTSGDVHFGLAFDDPPQGYGLANPQDVKAFSVSLLQGASVRLEGRADWIEKSDLSFSEKAELFISVTEQALKGGPKHLVYHPKTLVLGIGTERGASGLEAIKLADAALLKENLSPKAVAAVTSIDLKADEGAVHDVARHFQVDARFFTKEALLALEGRLKNPSKIVKREIGVAGVAEAASLALVPEGRLIVEKQKSKRTTLAIVRAPEPLTSPFKGEGRGRLSLIGVGPGKEDWRSFEAVERLARATDWVGYDLYLDLIADLKSNHVEHRFPLGAEEKRVRHGLELAAKGKDVAVVCSGDPGIFAMATLAYELIDTGAAEGPVSEAAKRVELEVMPGISAFQAAAARAGAPIGHDFCCISLSDLLTPREAILKRLHAAAEADFVVAFYNPRSKRRTTLIEEAFDILRHQRPHETPVILATDLGRSDETVRIVDLETVNSNDIDMLTLVIVGSSQSRTVETGDGKKWVYTPRGYHRKIS